MGSFLGQQLVIRPTLMYMTDAKVNLCPWSKECLRQVFSFTIIHIVINPKTKQK